MFIVVRKGFMFIAVRVLKVAIHGDDYISKHSDKLTLQHRKVIRALSLCRTGELGS